MTRQTTKAKICNLEVEVRKNTYDGLWNIVYSDDGMKWAGPYKTRREAVERLEWEVKE